ncbi:uncharacterized protein LOC131598193 [Vicia villosa]|uniref:uncharacterized protein LOC131598193 n=1 Tax=Vicia villosa TaxID=3911 RepID=UPI00273C948E|nr:uncharacterized protein LOC131598193 [Vicia villosa]
MKNRVDSFIGWNHGNDSVLWNKETTKEFTVASCYSFYLNLQIPFGPPNRYDGLFGFLWKMEVPFKIKAFGWRLFLDRLPTIDGLVYRGMNFPFDTSKCALCGLVSEDRDHYFFGCLVGKKIWNVIAMWVGKGEFLDNKCMPHFWDWHLYFRSRKVKDSKLDLVWIATIWALWLLRNGVRFRKEA